MSKHVSGPWQVSTLRPSGAFYIQNQQGYMIAKIDPLFAYKPRHEANARLIALAPAMLDAIKRATPWIGKMIADGGHLNAVAPNDAVGALQQLDAILKEAGIYK